MFGIKSAIQNYLAYKGLPAEHHLFNTNSSKIVFEEVYSSAIVKFSEVYARYTSSISSSEMAVSLELCACLYAFCHLLKPKKILDMGSGLSSYILRTYQAEVGDVEVFSIDDNKEWLNKTTDFLNSASLSTKDIYLLKEKRLEKNSFDLIFHDLNFVEERIKHVDTVIALAREGAHIIFDDVHKRQYFISLTRKLKAYNLEYFTLKKYSLDRFKRFSIVARK